MAGASQAFFADDFNGGTHDTAIPGTNGWVTVHEEGGAELKLLIYDGGAGVAGTVGATRPGGDSANHGMGRNITGDVVGSTSAGVYEVSAMVTQGAGNVILYAGDERSILHDTSDGSNSDNFLSDVPEPASLARLGLGGLMLCRRRQR